MFTGLLDFLIQTILMIEEDDILDLKYGKDREKYSEEDVDEDVDENIDENVDEDVNDDENDNENV